MDWDIIERNQKKLSIVNKKAILLQITMANKINIALKKDPEMESSNNIIALLQSSIT